MTRESTIAVIGCGGIGSRHLEALGKLSAAAAVVYAVDPSTDATARAAALFEGAKQSTGSSATLVQRRTIRELPDAIDVAIVATHASVRLAVLAELLPARTVRHLVLEKFLFSQRHHFAAADALLGGRDTAAWVNCTRRVYPGYVEIARQLQGAAYVDVLVSGSARQVPLGTIGIHFIDLLDHLCGSAGPVGRSTVGSASLLPANRGLRDFGGILEVRRAEGNGYLRYDANPLTDAPHLVTVASDKARFVIDERAQKVDATLASTGWKTVSNPFPVPYQSALTHLVVEELLARNECGLPSYTRSAAIHLDLFDALMPAFRELENNPLLEELPFT